MAGCKRCFSYGVAVRSLAPDRQATRELRGALRQAVPIAHVDFLSNCVLSHTEGDYVFVHAGVRPGRTMEQQTRNDLLWIREDFLRARLPLPGKVVVHGHTICEVPQDLGYRIDIDTGAFASGRLTCLVIRGGNLTFPQHGSPVLTWGRLARVLSELHVLVLPFSRRSGGSDPSLTSVL